MVDSQKHVYEMNESVLEFDRHFLVVSVGYKEQHEKQVAAMM